MADGSTMAPAKNKFAPDPIDITVGNRIRLTRKQRGMSQEALAKMLGISFQQVQKYERAANRVSASMIHKIAEALQTSISELFGENESAGSPALLADLAVDGAAELLKRYVAAGPESRDILLGAARASRPSVTG